MKVFLTGGTGHIGSAVLPALLRDGHEVGALARSDDSARTLEAAGASVVRGDLTDATVLRDAAAAADAAIHLGSPGDASSADVDRAAAAAIQDGLGDGRYVHTGGVWVLGDTDGLVDEDAPQSPPPITAWRGEVEAEVLGRVNAVLVMPGVVYGRRKALLELAYGPQDDGRGRYPGDGGGHVSVVHVDDVADLYVLALGFDAGTVVAGVAEVVTTKAVADALSQGGEAVAEAAADMEARLGPLAAAMALDQQVSGERARGLGWAPGHTDAVGDLPLG